MGRQVISLLDLRREVKNRILALRSIDNTLSNASLDYLWDAVSSKARDELVTHVLNDNRESVKCWMRKYNERELEEWPALQLKQLASTLKIANWSRLSRHELIMAIKNRKAIS